jgi:hypothetical protein
MPLWLILVQGLFPSILAAVKAAADSMQDGATKNRIEAAVQLVIEAEGLAHADPDQVSKAVATVHSLVYGSAAAPTPAPVRAAQVDAAPAAAAPAAPAAASVQTVDAAQFSAA